MISERELKEVKRLIEVLKENSTIAVDRGILIELVERYEQTSAPQVVDRNAKVQLQRLPSRPMLKHRDGNDD